LNYYVLQWRATVVFFFFLKKTPMMMISSELVDALKFNSSTSSSIANENNILEYDDESICGSLPVANDDDNDVNVVGTSRSVVGNDPTSNVSSVGVVLTLEDYEPPASLLMAVLEAERQMDEALSSFSSECSSVVAAGAPQVLCDDHDVDNSNDDDNVIAETIFATSTDHVVNEGEGGHRDTRESMRLEALTYSEAKRMAFSPLEAPNTVDRGGVNLNLESPCTDGSGSDLPPLEAFLPNPNCGSDLPSLEAFSPNSNCGSDLPSLEAFLPNSNCIASVTPPSNTPPLPPQQPKDRPSSQATIMANIARRRREALLKHKERTTTRTNQQPKTPLHTQPHNAHTLTRPLSSSTTKTNTTTITNRTYKSPTQTQVISPTLRNTVQKQAHSQQQKKQIPSTKISLKPTTPSTTNISTTTPQILQSHPKPKLSRSKSSGGSGAAGTTTTTITTTCSTPLVQTKAPITRPKSPNFRTTARLGKPTQQIHPTPTRISSKNENDAHKHTNSNKIHKLTIPRPPRLSTSERHGEKVYSTTAAAAIATAIPTTTEHNNTYSNRSAENSVTSINNTNNKTRLFMTDTKSALALPPHFVNTLRDHSEANHGGGSHVNTMSPTSSSIKRKKEPLSVTIPITPQVLKRSTRHSRPTTASPNPNELSTQQKRELEEMAYIATHQFKARALPKTTTTVASNTFHNHSRASLSQNTTTTTKGPRTFAVAPPTMTPLSSTDEIELTKKFRALPLPKFLAKATTATKPLAKKNHDPDFASRPKIITIPTPRKPHHPKVPSETATFLRGAHNPRTSSGSIHENIKITPRPPKPFNLLSEMRGVMHQEQLQERIRLEEQQRNSLTRSFKATPVPNFLNKRPTPSRKHSITPLTEPCEFRLHTDLRHEIHQAELESKIEAMETRRVMESVIKPLPIPKTLYTPTFKPVMPSELGREPIQGSAPHLETVVQSKRRQSFDQEAKGRREKEERIKKLMEQEEELETDREIRELRQLPANEGGFNPVTNTASLRKLGSSQVTPNAIPARLSLHQ
jgi:hypothetical protein